MTGQRARRGRIDRYAERGRRRPFAAGALLPIAAALCLLAQDAGAADSYDDPPMSTMATNMGQPTNSERKLCLNKEVDGLQQSFTTGPNPSGYQLDKIWLTVRGTHESRYMTIDARLDEVTGGGHVHVADLTRGQLDDNADNAWQAPDDTYLEPDTEYVFTLDCVQGCANDNVAQFGTTTHRGEDSATEPGWTIGDRLNWRSADDRRWYREPWNALRMRVEGRPSPSRAYRTEIVSTPKDGHTYRLGETIDIALTYNAPVYVPPASPLSIDMLLGDAEDGSDNRDATYLSGSGTWGLVFRYRVQLGDRDGDGIAVNAGGADSGYVGSVPTLVWSFGQVPVERHYPGLPDQGGHRVDGSFRVTGLDITSTPAHPDGYRLGEDIEVTLTFSTDAHAKEASSIAIRVGEAAAGANYRAARYVSGSGTRRLVYRYRVQEDDRDADGIGVDVGGPDSGFAGPLPTTAPELGSIPVRRAYSGIPDDPAHKVEPALAAAFAATSLTASEGGAAASVTITLDRAPPRAVTVPVVVALGDGATAADYALSAPDAAFAPGETEKSLTLAAVDDDEDDDGETVTVSFGALPPGVRAGERSSVVVAIADDDGQATGQTVTLRPGRDAYIAGLDDVVFNLSLAEAADRAIRVNVRLTQDRPFLDARDLLRHVEFPAHATAAELRIHASGQRARPAQSGTLTATLVLGSGYHVGTPAAASVRMAASIPALIARLGRTSYSFEERARGGDASVEVFMETQPGLPPPNRSHAVTLSTEAGSATAGSDFVPVDETLTFAPEDYAAAGGRWVARKTVELAPVDDDEDEPDETFTVTLSRDASPGDLVQVRNPNRTRCGGPCRASVTIADNDVVGVSFLDGDGAPLAALRLTVREGGQAAYRMKLDRQPAGWMLLVVEPGDGDADLEPQLNRSWLISPDAEPSSNPGAGPNALAGTPLEAARNAHHWTETFTVTVEALQDDDVYPGERRFHHYLVSGDAGPARIELPDVVVVEVDNEASGPLRTFGAPEVVSEPASDGAYEAGERIEIRMVFTRPVTVTGSPYLEFDLGSADAARKARAGYAGGDGTQDIVFAYTVQAEDRDDDGIEIPAGSIRLNDGAIRDAGSGELSAIEYGAAGIQPGHRVHAPAALAAADAETVEKRGARLDFEVTLSRTVPQPVTVDYATADGTARAGQDYVAADGTLTFAAGETRKTVSVAVLDDDHDEGEETLTLTLGNASGALVADDRATGTIVNDDPIPQAWLARFGRTVGEQVIEAVEERLRATPAPGVEMRLAGQSVGASGSPLEDRDGPAFGTGGPGPKDGAAPGPAGQGEARSPLAAQSRSASGDALLTGSSFSLTGETGTGGAVALWGRGAHSRFDGREGALSLDGEVTSVMLGADWTGEAGAGSGAGAWTAGLLVSRSEGAGGYRGGSGGGTVESRVAGVYPYGRYAPNDRVALWGMAGYGAGELALLPQDGAAMRTDMDLVVGAVGVRGVALEPGPEGGIELTATSDAMAVRTRSERTEGLDAAAADASRFRFGLEGTWHGLAFGETDTLAPRLEIGMRHDGGDAETGFGLDLGGGLAWSDPESGLSAQASGRGLLTHESRGFRARGMSASLSWTPGGGTGRGPSVALNRTVGSAATGGMKALLGRQTLAGIGADDGNGPGSRRLELRLGYGLAALGDRFTATPEFGLGLADGRREYTLGWRFELAEAGPTALALRLEATRREAADDKADPEHGLGLGLTARW